MTRRFRRTGIILPVVLVLIGLLALLTAGFTFFTRAEIAGSIANAGARQARLAADSGLEEITSILRDGRDDVTLWQNNPNRLRHALVWSDAFTREDDPVRVAGSRLELFEEGQPAIAFCVCIVAMNLDDPNGESIRYGITAESSKLNINVATDQQLEQLLTPILAALEIENAQELINALLDWRDGDDDLREGGAENEYYNTLEPPYRAKNGPLDTVEEILIVSGFNAAILYGEDVNRNGVLDAPPAREDPRGGGVLRLQRRGGGRGASRGLLPLPEADRAGRGDPGRSPALPARRARAQRIPLRRQAPLRAGSRAHRRRDRNRNDRPAHLL